MAYRRTHRGKQGLSAHQKQIRFFVGLSVLLSALLAMGFFWLLSRPTFLPH
ncbi:MAG: hypothetical protein WAO02_11340 [Verrucomicrobiia bacterium]